MHFSSRSLTTPRDHAVQCVGVVGKSANVARITFFANALGHVGPVPRSVSVIVLVALPLPAHRLRRCRSACGAALTQLEVT